MSNVRLTPAEQTAIRELAERHFGIGTDVRQYGSRADTNARGEPLTAFEQHARSTGIRL